MKRFFFLLVSLSFIVGLRAETIIDDGTVYTADTTWLAANSPYIINGELVVAASTTLTIEPGVTVKLKTGTNNDYSQPEFDLGFMRINGKLLAEGTETDSILFTRDGEEAYWGVILFAVADSSSCLKYCSIKYGNQVAGILNNDILYGALSFYESDSIKVSYSTINQNNTDGIFCLYHSSPKIINNRISKNLCHGIHCHYYSSPLISNNTITNNGREDYYDQDAILCIWNSSPTIIHNLISENNNNGIFCMGASPIIKNNTIQKSKNNGVCCSGSAPIIMNNIIQQNGESGCKCKSAFAPTIINNIIRENNYGISCYWDSRATIEANTITHNHFDGIQCCSSQPFVNNNIIRDNEGSGLFCDFSSPTIINSTMDHNHWDGIRCINESSPNIRSNNVYNNNNHGIYCFFSSSPIVESNTITANDDDGIFCEENSSPIILNNTINNNNKNGINCNYDTSPSITDNVIRDNNENGIISNSYLSSITRNMIMGNGQNGILSTSSVPIINNAIIQNEHNGILCSFPSSSHIINNSICENNETGIYCYCESVPTVTSSIIWGNNNGSIHADHFDPENDVLPLVSFSCIEGGYEGEGNMDIDPLFTDSANGDYSLLESSPCVNAGTPDTIGLNLPALDLSGNSRIYGGRIDMGAYEYQIVPTENSIPTILPSRIVLSNYPNPFNPETTIQFNLPQSGHVELTIYNVKGQRVKTLLSEDRVAGTHSIVWNGQNEAGENVASGLYFYRLNLNGQTQAVKKMMLMK